MNEKRKETLSESNSINNNIISSLDDTNIDNSNFNLTNKYQSLLTINPINNNSANLNNIQDECYYESGFPPAKIDQNNLLRPIQYSESFRKELNNNSVSIYDFDNLNPDSLSNCNNSNNKQMNLGNIRKFQGISSMSSLSSLKRNSSCSNKNNNNDANKTHIIKNKKINNIKGSSLPKSASKADLNKKLINIYMDKNKRNTNEINLNNNNDNNSCCVYNMLYNSINKINRHNNLEEIEKRIVQEWRIVAAFVDKILFWIFFLFTFIFTVACLIVVPMLYSYDKDI